MQSEMFSLAQYIKDNQDQDFLSLPESLYDNFDDNQFQDNSNQSNPFEPLNQINNPDALKNCTRLVELSLAGNNIENVSVLQGSKESLQKLNLSQNKVKNVAEIFPMPELKNLSLDDNMIDTLYLEGTEKLSYLSARNNQIDSLTGRFEKMTYMDLANNKLSGEIDLSKCSKLRNAFLENNYISSVILYTDTLNYGNISIYNNPVAKINKADKKLSYDIYMSYHDDLKDYLGERFSSKLYLADCPLDLRVSYEEVWGKFSVEFCDSGEIFITIST